MAKKNEEIANELAKSLGFESADYIGKDGELSIYMGNSVVDGEPAPTGLPLWISVDKSGKTDYNFGFKYMYLVKEE